MSNKPEYPPPPPSTYIKPNFANFGNITQPRYPVVQRISLLCSLFLVAFIIAVLMFPLTMHKRVQVSSKTEITEYKFPTFAEVLSLESSADLVNRSRRTYGLYITTPLGGFCPEGQVPFLSPQNGVAQGCIRGSGCPPGYTCQISSTQQYLCCGYPGRCPAGQTLYTDVANHYLSCTCCPNVYTNCPGAAQCQQAVGGPPGQYLCCQTGGLCPGGGTPYINQGINAPMHCNVGGYTSCPPPYSCQISTTGVSVCCSATSLFPTALPYDIGYHVCPFGSPPYAGLGTGVQQCSPGDYSGCPLGFNCVASSAFSGRYVCCQGAITPTLPPFGQGLCPYNYAPYLGINGLPQACSIGSATSCPSGYSCVQTNLGGGLINYYVCCRPDTVIAIEGCASGRAAYRLGNSLEYCTPGIQSCPLGYQCELSSRGTRYICCQTGSLVPTGMCPNNGILLPTVTICQIGLPGSCPAGPTAVYTCTILSNGQTGCCSATSGLCANNQPSQPPIGGSICLPVGSTPSPITGQTVGTCPIGTTCTMLQSGQFGCCTGAVGVTCPDGSISTQTCVVGAVPSQCIVPATCQTLSDGLGHCCAAGVTVRCPDQSIPTQSCVITATPPTCVTPATCQVLSDGLGHCCGAVGPQQCPNGGTIDATIPTCQTTGISGCNPNEVCLVVAPGVNRCCTSGTPGTFTCQSGTQALIVNGQPQVCNFQSPNCRAGYVCQRSADATQFWCCQGPRCPGGITVGSTPPSCDPNQPGQCGPGNNCQQAVNIPGNFICCPTQRFFNADLPDASEFIRRYKR